VTPVGQILWDEHVRAFEDASYHTKEPEEALRYAERKVQAELDKIASNASPPNAHEDSLPFLVGAMAV
jgi:multiple sugar transport system permease protein